MSYQVVLLVGGAVSVVLLGVFLVTRSAHGGTLRRAAKRFVAPLSIALVVGLSVITALILADDGPKSQESSQVSVEQYLAQISTTCGDATDKMHRLDAMYPDGPDLAAVLAVEQDYLDQVASVRPPPALEIDHKDLIATWRERIQVLQKMTSGAMTEAELPAEVAESDRLAGQASEIYRKVGAQECVF